MKQRAVLQQYCSCIKYSINTVLLRSFWWFSLYSSCAGSTLLQIFDLRPPLCNAAHIDFIARNRPCHLRRCRHVTDSLRMPHADERLPQPQRAPDANARRRSRGADDPLVCVSASDDATETSEHCAAGARHSHSHAPFFGGAAAPGAPAAAESTDVRNGRAQIIPVETPDELVRMPHCVPVSSPESPQAKAGSASGSVDLRCVLHLL